MGSEKAEVGHYSKHRTRRGNVQVGRLHGKTNLEIQRNMQSLNNLFKRKRVKRKWESAGKLAAKREGNKLKA